ncbi:MAG TPA: hypothetical protein DEP05_07660 [Betaproteobacteria bacterium]|nr:hypothetical protein [Betaproteobacteria bacterium]
MVSSLLSACAASPQQPLSNNPPLAASPQPIVRQDNIQDKTSRQNIVLYAFGLIGIDYRFGGGNPASGLDCSGMVRYIYRNAAAINLPHNAYRMARMGRKISRAELKPGDLVFFNTLHRPYSHVGIYIGNHRFIHAPHTNGKIEISNLNSPYFSKHYEAARSFFN